MHTTPLRARLGAEFLGTFGLVFGGCGSAVLAATFLNDDGVQLGIGFLGVALAFGLTVLTGAYAFGHVSGGHFNPAVSVGLALAGRFEWRQLPAYVITQVVAASAAGAVLFIIAVSREGSSVSSVMESGFASNGYGEQSPGGYGLGAALLIEIVLTAAFLYVILGATDDRAPKGFAPIAIGLALTLIHLISIPVTNTSVNPARSLGVAWFAGGDALSQVWLFIVAPVIGAAIAGLSYAWLTGARGKAVDEGVANNPEIGTAQPAS
ncbi:aquaporin Z [Desertihabitans brevis]|uniref:Aquaporin Z n=1 Tax=Desertihabitans brevis TaxID=2268447 RepID=A0A367YZS1_9ACTN|nr:aquaporin Z [Desertihabitans brevis]RCK71344.1 aquaporin Z [Desertihabitans brevis]